MYIMVNERDFGVDNEDICVTFVEDVEQGLNKATEEWGYGTEELKNLLFVEIGQAFAVVPQKPKLVKYALKKGSK